jgi:hypothetical protein
MTGSRRSAVLAVIVLGAYLVVVPFALSLFHRTVDAEKLADQYRSFATEEGLGQFSEHTDVVVRGGQQLLDDGLPGFADDLGMTDAEFDELLDDRFPNVAVYRDRAPEVFAYLVPAVAVVAGQADNVADADDFPVAGVPVTVGPWALLGAGAVLVAAGLWARTAPRRVATTLALVAGVGLVAGPLVLGWPHKVSAAEDVAEAARIAFTPAVAQATTADTYMIDAAVIELREAMLPAIGVELGRSRAEMEAAVAADLPEVAIFLRDWEAGLSASAHDISQSQIRFMDEFHDADATPYRALPWLFVGPGLVVAAIAVGSILLDRRSTSPPAVDETR